MLSKPELDRLSGLNPSDTQPENLTDCYTYDGTVVKLKFSEGGRSLDEILVDHFSKLKNC